MNPCYVVFTKMYLSEKSSGKSLSRAILVCWLQDAMLLCLSNLSIGDVMFEVGRVKSWRGDSRIIFQSLIP